MKIEKIQQFLKISREGNKQEMEKFMRSLSDKDKLHIETDQSLKCYLGGVCKN